MTMALKNNLALHRIGMDILTFNSLPARRPLQKSHPGGF